MPSFTAQRLDLFAPLWSQRVNGRRVSPEIPLAVIDSPAIFLSGPRIKAPLLSSFNPSLSPR